MTPRAHPYRDLAVIDSRAPRFNQAVVALGAWLTLATGWWPVVGLLAVQLVVGLVFGRKYCLPCVAYFEWVQPRWGEGPLEDARAPRFANVLGAGFLLSAAVAWALGGVAVGQALTALVAVLATLASSTGVCVGCEVYKVGAALRGVRGGAVEQMDLAGLVGEPLAREESVVLLFTHPLCSACQDAGPRLSAGGERVVEVDVSSRKDVASKYGVSVVPLAFRVRGDGTVTARL